MFTNAIAPLLVRFGRAELIQALTSAGYLLLGIGLAWFGVAGHFPPATLVAITAVLLGAAAAWHLSHRRWHVIHDTPTALLRSAAQGYVELNGTAELSPGQHAAPFNGLPPCVWFEVLITDVSGPEVTRWTRTSDETFVLRDQTGECVIDPDHAEVHHSHVRRWSVGDRRYHARYIRHGEPLYAIGSLETLRGIDGGFDRRADVAHLLRQWKRNPVSLRRRFDGNKDGEISAEEWEAAVKEAQAIVDAQYEERRDHPDIHIMRAPRDGLPYILSNRDPEFLAKRFRHWSWFHGAAFLTASGTGFWLATDLL